MTDSAPEEYIPGPSYLDDARPLRHYYRQLRASTRLVLVVLLTAISLPIHFILHSLHPSLARFVRRFWHRMICRILSVKVDVSGTIDRKAVLFCGNHCSYLDIPVLGGIVDADFISKDDIDDWPGIGALARMADTMFISRDRTRTAVENRRIHDHMTGGRALILFPEGTSSDNSQILPFKSSFFAIAQTTRDGIPVRVQPFVLTFKQAGGQAVDMSRGGLRGGRALLDLVSWHDDMEFGAHVWRLLQTRHTRVRLEFLPSVTMDEAGGNRKALCQFVEDKVKTSFDLHR